MVCAAIGGLASVSTGEQTYACSTETLWRPPSRAFVEWAKGINDTAY